MTAFRFTQLSAVFDFMAGQTWEYKAPNGTWETYGNLKVTINNKIRIEPNQPINTKVFDEAVVLEYNGVPTAAGLKDRLDNHPYFVKEGEMKPIIDFINRL